MPLIVIFPTFKSGTFRCHAKLHSSLQGIIMNITPQSTLSSTEMPVILILGPHDPSGRQGIQAAIETIAGLGGHCVSVITALCLSGSDQTESVPIASHIIIQQARSILEDMPVAAIMVSHGGSISNVEAIHSILEDYPHIPVTCSADFQYRDSSLPESSEYSEALVELIISKCQLLVCDEAYSSAMSGSATVSEETIHPLVACGSEYLLVCKYNTSKRQLEYTHYSEQTVLATFSLPTECSGLCTAALGEMISAGTACFLGHGSSIRTAVSESLKFAEQAATQARRIGFGARIPNRFFWIK